MVKHTQTIRRQQPTNCLSVFDHFVKLASKGLNVIVPNKNESLSGRDNLLFILE